MQKLLLICLWIYIYLCSQFSEVCLEFLITKYLKNPVRPNIHFTTATQKYVWKISFFLFFRSSWILISRNQNRYSITSDHGKFDGQMLHLLLDLWKAVIAVTILKTANFRFEVARQKRKYSEAGLSWLVQAVSSGKWFKTTKKGSMIKALEVHQW